MRDLYEIPANLERILLSYIKKTYLPEKRINPKHAGEFNLYDIKFFARGAAEMSAYFTSERSQLPKNYLNKKELRAGYLLYFVVTNFLKVKYCLEEIKALERFKEKDVITIADIGCGPGTASLACADFWRKHSNKQKLEITAIDQNTNALHDAKRIFAEFAEDGASLRTIYSNLYPKTISRSLKTKFDIVISANFLNEFENIEQQADIVKTITEKHLEDNGLLIIIEPSLRWTTRNLMRLRDKVLDSGNLIAPCSHNNPCPMLKESDRDWCHMYLDWKRPEVIAKVDQMIGNRKDYIKFSYLIISKRSHDRTIARSHETWRVVSAPMRSKGKVELLLCNKNGLLRVTRQDKNQSDLNSDFDHIKRGDIVFFSGNPSIEKTTEFKILL